MSKTKNDTTINANNSEKSEERLKVLIDKAKEKGIIIPVPKR
jgi:predicted HTH domain antitoxin